MTTCKHCDGTGLLPVMKSTGRQRTRRDGSTGPETKPGRVPCPFCDKPRGVTGNTPLAGSEKRIVGNSADRVIADEVDDYGSASGSIDAIDFYSGKI